MSIRSLDRVPRDVMERRHYEQLAWVIAQCVGRVDNHLVQDFIKHLWQLNTNMKPDTFMLRIDEHIKSR